MAGQHWQCASKEAWAVKQVVWYSRQDVLLALRRYLCAEEWS